MAVKHLNYKRSWGAVSLLDATSDPVEITNTFAVLGGVGNVKGVKSLFVWLDIDVNSSTDVQIKALTGFTSTNINYQLPIETASASKVDVQAQVHEFPDADNKFVVEIPLNEGISYVQLYVKDAATGSGQIESAYATFKVKQRKA